MSLPRKYPPAFQPEDWNAMVDAINKISPEDWDAIIAILNGDTPVGILETGCSFIIRNTIGVPSYCEAISGNGTLTYGGATNANGVVGTNAAAVWQAAIDNGTLIYVRDGDYTFTSRVIITSSHHHVTGESGNVRVLSTLLPCFQVDGGYLNGGAGEVDTFNDLVFKNLQFVYTGEIIGTGPTGNFVEILGVQNDFNLLGALVLDNVQISSTNYQTPETTAQNQNFVGLWLAEFVGVAMRNSGVSGFGTGIVLYGSSPAGESDMMLFENVNIAYCYIGINSPNNNPEEDGRGFVNRVTAINLKVMYCLDIGFASEAYNNVLINPQFESEVGAGGIGIQVETGQLTLLGGTFHINNVGIYFGYLGAPYKNYAILTGTWFEDNTNALTLVGKTYLYGCHFADNYETIRLNPAGGYGEIFGEGEQTEHGNAGTATITSGHVVTTVTHGCSFTPLASDIIVVLTNQPTSAIGDVSITNISSTSFNINCRNNPGTSGANFSWSIKKVQGE